MAERPTPELTCPDRALELVLEHTPSGRIVDLPVAEMVGLRLALPLVAEVPQPPFSRALMDGYAVRTAARGQALPVVGEVAAGGRPSGPVEPGAVTAIMTGAPCPPGTEAVVKIEDTAREGEAIRLPATIVEGQHVQRAGELCAAGATVVRAGAELTPLGLAAAIACGCTRGQAVAPPTLAIVTTGDELRRPDAPLEEGQIYDSNGPMLAAMARALGLAAPEQLHASDDPAELAAVIERAAAADIVVLSGGVSMGRYDRVPHIVASLGAETIFHKVRQKPGKPLLFAVRDGKLLFGLPGTPLGSHLGMHRYVGACIRKWTGRTPARPRRTGTLLEPVRYNGARTLFRLVRVERAAEDDRWRIDPLQWRGSSDLVGPALANGYCRFEPGRGELAAGTPLPFELIEESP